jgi:DNA repair exonuclease SbcCD ATPase subunit
LLILALLKILLIYIIVCIYILRNTVRNEKVMARGGISKTDVKRARDTLLASNNSISIDSVRFELGNTGSKTTIHRYLRELEDEDSKRASPVTLSQELQVLVGQVAARLQEESNAKIQALQERHAIVLGDEQAQAEQMKLQLISSQRQSEQLQERLNVLIEKHTIESDSHQQTKMDLATSLIQLQGSHQQIAEQNKHIGSLEDKHRHARDSLEHYRESVKTQREQDIRRHEHQVLQLQTEVRSTNQSVIVKQQELTSMQQRNTQLNTKIEILIEQQHKENQRLSDYEQKLMKSLRDMQQLEQRLKSCQELVQQNESEIIHQKNHNFTLISEVEALRIERTKLQTCLDTQKEIVDKWFTNIRC